MASRARRCLLFVYFPTFTESTQKASLIGGLDVKPCCWIANWAYIGTLAVILLGSRIVVSISKSYEHVPNDV